MAEPASEEPIAGFIVPVHRSLTEPILLAGAPRAIAIINGTLAAALGLGLRQWIVGIVLWVIGSVSNHAGSKKVKGGPLVVGELLSAERTGWRVNDNPQVQLTFRFRTQPGYAHDGLEVTATCKVVVSDSELAHLDPGDLLPLRYDPDNPQDVMIDTDVDHDTLQQAFNQHRVATGKMTPRALDNSQNGVQANGVVLASRPTGEVVDGSARIELQLRVTRPDGTVFDVTTVKTVDGSVVSRTIPGNVLPVFYLPHDEQDVVVGFPMG